MQTTQLCFVGKEAATKGVSRGVDPDELKERRRYKKKKRRVDASMEGASGPDVVLNVASKRREVCSMKDQLSEEMLTEEGSRAKDDFFNLLFTSEQAIWKTLLKERISYGLRQSERSRLIEWERHTALLLTCLWSTRRCDESPSALFDTPQTSQEERATCIFTPM